MKIKRRIPSIVLAVLAWVAINTELSAQLYWDINGSGAGAGGATPAGTWSASAANWTSVADGTGVTAGWVDGSAAVFSSDVDAVGAYTVTLGGNVSASSISMEEGSPTLLGGANTLSLVSPASISVASGSNLAMRTVIGGAAGLTIQGPGMVTLYSNTTYTGDTLLNAGTVRLQTTTATFGANSLGTLFLNGGAIHQNVGNRVLDNPIVMNGDTLIYAPPAGTGTRYLYIGATGKSFTTVGGTLSISNETTAANVALNTFSVRFQTNVTFTRPIVLQSTVPGLHDASIDTYAIEGTLQTFSGDISGNGYFRRLFGAANTGNTRTHPGGDTVFTGNNTFSGGLLINGGFVGFGSSSTGAPNSVDTSPAGTGLIYINAGAVNGNTIAVNDNTVVGMYAVNGPQTVGNRVFIDKSTNIIFKGANDLTLSGRVSLPTLQSLVFQVTNTGLTTLSGMVDAGWTDFTLTKAGPGTLVISGDATYLHHTAVSEGKLVVNGQLTVSPTMNVANGATLGGTGTITAPVTCPGTIGAGVNAPGTLTLQGGLDLSASGTYTWRLGANSTSSDFDQIVLTGGNLALGPSAKISIGFTGTATTPTNSQAFWQSAQSWRVINLSGGSNSGDTSFGSVLNGSFTAGFFTVSNDASGVLLNYIPNVGAVPPSVSLQPQNATVNFGGSASFISAANGSAPLTYRWKKDGINVVNGTTAWGAVISGATTTNLLVSAATYHEAGNYTLSVTNSSGDDESFPATLTVIDPYITANPADRTNTAGTTATFSVTAVGSGLTYQWSKNGVPLIDGGNISGATASTLTITGVSLSDAGDYRVLVSGASGNQTNSAIAKLIWFATGQSITPPIGFWQLNEGAGQFIADSSGNGLNGYLGTNSLLVDASDPAWSLSGEGKSGSLADHALYFGGTTLLSGRVNDNPLLNQTAAITLVVDFDPDTHSQGVLLSKHAGGTAGSYMLSVPSGANYRFTIINASNTRKDLDWPVPNDLNDGYHQLVGTYDGVTMRLFYDGILRAETAFSGAIKVVTTPLMIGNFSGTGWTYRGFIDNAALFSTALSDGGVLLGETAAPGSGVYQLYHQGVASFTPPTLSITDVSVSGGIITFNISKQNVTSYNVQRITNLGDTWVNVATNQTGTQYSEPVSGTTAFYQLVVP
jgi:autotransporter-associated beta strand protein